ncbi:hypothetical protein [Synechococcus sp. MIT S1220]|uniref:hypothetical protein n=1 Tax=Synechococcus sp. MIT S1220 TaxID=3082549 RepID=UPI0039AF7C9C
MDARGRTENGDRGDLAPELAFFLLAWWEAHGRRDVVHKPWMFSSDGDWPYPQDELDPYGIWIAEVMRCSAA